MKIVKLWNSNRVEIIRNLEKEPRGKKGLVLVNKHYLYDEKEQKRRIKTVSIIRAKEIKGLQEDKEKLMEQVKLIQKKIRNELEKAFIEGKK